MKLKLLALLLLVGLAGCGLDQSESIYDTTGNPDNFPAMAVTIISDLQDNQLTGSDAITTRFGELYSEHAELLDSDQWRTVIVRLGGHFHQIADSLAAGDIGSFLAAAEYYQLGSFARPDDTYLRSRAALFACWLGADQSPLIDLAALTSGQALDLDQILSATRYFLLGDSLYRQFFASQLFPVFNQQIETAELLNPANVEQLAPADRALIVTARFATDLELEPIAVFRTPHIDLVGARISRLDANNLQVELYFIPRDSIAEPIQLFVRLDSIDKTTNPVQFEPRPPATTWSPGQIVAVSRIVSYRDQLGLAAIGLSDFATPRPNFQPIDGSTATLFLLDQACLILN